MRARATAHRFGAAVAILALGGVVLAVAREPGPATARVGEGASRTKIVSAPKNGTTKHRARFEFSTTVAGASFECKLDRGPFEACDSPVRYRQLKHGRHRFRVRSVDTVGRANGSAATHRWRVARRYNPEHDVKGNDLPPSPGSPADKFEQHCERHPASCA